MTIDPISPAVITYLIKLAIEAGWKQGSNQIDKKIQQQVGHAIEEYVRTYEKRHCTMKYDCLRMDNSLTLEEIYTDVQVLNTRESRRFESPEALRELFLETGRGFIFENTNRQEGIAVANLEPRLMVLGSPGIGKSTFLKKIGLEALKYETARFRHQLIPVFIELKRFGDQHSDISRLIAEEFETCGLPNVEEFTQNLLKAGKLLILLDGLDEVPTAYIDQAISQIETFVDKYDKNRFIASCRIAAYKGGFPRFKDVTMANFNDSQMQIFVRQWFRREPKVAEQYWQLLDSSEYKAVKELGQTPLLLTLLCAVYDESQSLPKRRSALYGEALEVWLKKWAAERRVHRDPIYQELNLQLEQVLLSEIAYQSFAEDQLFFSKRDLTDQIRAFLVNNLNAPKNLDAEKVLYAIQVQQGIFVEQARDVYSFSHLIFQEYLAAQFIVDEQQLETLVTDHLTDYRWQEVFLLVAGLTRFADPLLSQIEQKCQKDIQSSELRKLLQWSEQIVDTVESQLPIAAQRAIAVFAALNSILNTDSSLRNITAESADVQDFISTLGIEEGDVDFFLEGIPLELKKAPFNLSKNEIEELNNYFYTYSILLKCKKSALRVSPQLWSGIEDKMLFVPPDNQSQAITITERFFEQAGISIQRISERILRTNASTSSSRFSGIRVLITATELRDSDIDELLRNPHNIETTLQDSIGILVYQEAPGTAARMKLAEARLNKNLILVPIPIAEFEKALLGSKDTCLSVLAEYVNKYVQEADLFDDKNAISDTLTFFGRMKLLNRIKEELLRYQGIGLFGLRKSGKTTILYQLGFSLREYPVITIDLQGYGNVHYGADLFNEIIRQLERFVIADEESSLVIPFEKFESGVPAIDLSIQFIERIDAITRELQSINRYKFPILCFLDEMERVLPRQGDNKERIEEFNAVFGTLRRLVQERKQISLLVTDVYPDCNRINYWFDKDTATNPLFSFFKEMFLSPFSEQETVEMLTDIGKLMGVVFDQETLKRIYAESGGHPFIARQLSRFLVENLNGKNTRIIWENAREELQNSPLYFDELNNYYEESIWKDLENRNFTSALAILDKFASQDETDSWLTQQELSNNVSDMKRYLREIAWLTEVGLISCDRQNDKYRVQMSNFLRWLQL